jgi:ribosomal protein S12 methylthiotransferase
MFDSAGYKATFDEDGFKGGAVVINTCGFIGDAKEESVNMIIEAINAKNEGLVDKVFVMGCLAERYSKELPAELPEVDGWYGKFDWTKIVNGLSVTVPADVPAWERILSTPSHHAYVKIAEGCNRFCAFCAIPLITGRYQSRPIEEILDEVTSLVARGVSEFNILAQDLSYYGHDIYGKSALAELIDRMAGLQGVHRIRLHYAYPADFPYDVLPVMARHKNVCKYLDIALQHISDKVLDNMRRHINGEETRQLLARIRKKVPGIHIRTTLMVGFPGEGEAEFEELKDFVREQRFERMGAFAYCEEEDTYAAEHFDDSIPEDVKQQRLDEIMAIQEEVALESNRSKVGKTLEVVIDSENDDYYVGRTEFDSPEVDPEVLITKTKELKIGEYYNIEITSAETFELFGIPV